MTYKRGINEEEFVSEARRMLEETGELSMTRHTTRKTYTEDNFGIGYSTQYTSYRLWSQEPEFESGNHPDWTRNSNVGVAEYSYEGGIDEDDRMLSLIFPAMSETDLGKLVTETLKVDGIHAETVKFVYGRKSEN